MAEKKAATKPAPPSLASGKYIFSKAEAARKYLEAKRRQLPKSVKLAKKVIVTFFLFFYFNPSAQLIYINFVLTKALNKLQVNVFEQCLKATREEAQVCL
jgi:hypothetical protein